VRRDQEAREPRTSDTRARETLAIGVSTSSHQGILVVLQSYDYSVSALVPSLKK